jgi:hypothetical protein
MKGTGWRQTVEVAVVITVALTFYKVRAMEERLEHAVANAGSAIEQSRRATVAAEEARDAAQQCER